MRGYTRRWDCCRCGARHYYWPPKCQRCGNQDLRRVELNRRTGAALAKAK